MSNRNRPTLRASQRGKLLIKEARIRKIAQFRKAEGKIDINTIFLREASKILEPNREWGNFEPYAVGEATWRRFLQGRQRITNYIFQAFCQVLGLNWEDVVESEIDADIDLNEAPLPIKIYGRKLELVELQQCLTQQRCRLVLVYGMGGVGKSALVRTLVDRITSNYLRLIWISLQSAPTFSETLTQLAQFFSRGEKETGNINEIMQYLHQERCLIVLDDWEEIIDNQGEDYTQYNQFLERVHRTRHQSCLLVISRRRPQNIETLRGKFFELRRLSALTDHEVREFLNAEGLFGSSQEIQRFSIRYNNPWILERMIKMIKTVFNGDISPFMNNHEFTTFIDEVTTDFLNQQFKTLSLKEIKLIYWVSLRRNTASWEQLVQDSQGFLTYQELFGCVNSLINQHALLNKNIEEEPLIYLLEPVILKYTTERFIEEIYQQIIQVVTSRVIQGSELFISHNFITEDSIDDELIQQQMRRIVQPIQRRLLNSFRSTQDFETQLREIQSRLAAQGYNSKNISHLLA